MEKEKGENGDTDTPIDKSKSGPQFTWRPGGGAAATPALPVEESVPDAGPIATKKAHSETIKMWKPGAVQTVPTETDLPSPPPSDSSAINPKTLGKVYSGTIRTSDGASISDAGAVGSGALGKVYAGSIGTFRPLADAEAKKRANPLPMNTWAPTKPEEPEVKPDEKPRLNASVDVYYSEDKLEKINFRELNRIFSGQLAGRQLSDSELILLSEWNKRLKKMLQDKGEQYGILTRLLQYDLDKIEMAIHHRGLNIRNRISLEILAEQYIEKEKDLRISSRSAWRSRDNEEDEEDEEENKEKVVDDKEDKKKKPKKPTAKKTNKKTAKKKTGKSSPS